MNAPISNRRGLLVATVLLAWSGLGLDAPVVAQATRTIPKVDSKEKEKEKEKGKAKELVDLNSATAEELETLPGIGAAFSRKIIDGRPHKTVADLSAAGVPARTVDGLKSLVVVRPLPTPVDINLDPLERIETLPNIGPATAREIIGGRPYADYDDVAKVKGIGEAKLDALRGRLKFGKIPASTPKAESKTKALPRGKAESPKGASTTGAAAGAGAAGKVSLNKATLEQLETLPGIGPVRAKQIIDARPFAAIEDVMKIKGIKEVEFGKIKDMITVD